VGDNKFQLIVANTSELLFYESGNWFKMDHWKVCLPLELAQMEIRAATNLKIPI